MEQSQNRILTDLLDEVRRLTAANQQMATAVANLEGHYATELARAQQERERWAEKQKEMEKQSNLQQRELTAQMMEQNRQLLRQTPSARSVLVYGGLFVTFVGLVTAVITVVQWGLRRWLASG